ncbi:unnamed protein product [Didymodactylos carnosus]|uniref:Metalloendopeptidase n=1 Tax=Didymodactylos carnosus TaxID=1234261 RepID=A0A813PXL4_9BILA|nr:unnamed protein product [Didymodactylos carnosus]CAF3538263.1 unnamed protein product [Didymodactylos carnosus]
MINNAGVIQLTMLLMNLLILLIIIFGLKFVESNEINNRSFETFQVEFDKLYHRYHLDKQIEKLKSIKEEQQLQNCQHDAYIYENDILMSSDTLVRLYGKDETRKLLKCDQQSNKNANLTMTSNDMYSVPIIQKRSKRAVTAIEDHIWPDGIIPYEIVYNFSGYHMAQLLEAMSMWENETCIVFVQRLPHHNSWLSITCGECGCCSQVGKQGTGAHILSLGLKCDKHGIIAHELGHAIGFWHEHTRPDRDQYVEILRQNIKHGKIINVFIVTFEKE